MENANPYYRRWFKYSCALIEFRYFREDATAIAEREMGNIARAVPLTQIHGFIAKSFDRFTVQIWFGNHPTARELPDKKGVVTEKGATLLYSLGPTGQIAVILYPAE